MSDRVVLGEVVGVFGVRGEVRVHVYAPESGTLAAPREVWLAGQRRRLAIRPGAGRRILGKIDGVDTPEAAAALVGAKIEVDRAELPPPAKGEFYVRDLLGLHVVDEDGVDHGEIVDVVPGDRDVWVVEPEGWILATPEAVLSVGDVVRVARGAVERG